MSSKSLWADLSQLQLVRAPRTALLEQAQYLTEETKGTFVGVVLEAPTGGVGRFRYRLAVKVPSLNNYQIDILWIEHAIELYPVRLVAERTKVDVSCADEAEFEEAVGSVLSSSEITTLLSRLMSQLK
jgi:hypothetical protein